MKFLLPHRFKKIGLYLSPIGLALWIAMQRGYVTKFCTLLFGHDLNDSKYVEYYFQNVSAAVIGFFFFLFGLYFIAFSKEKIEDEMVQRTRMDSFQIAALIQFIIIIIGFLTIFICKVEEDLGLLTMFILSTMLFWISFVIRFNYILHFKIK